jgi:hypothetical protein
MLHTLLIWIREHKLATLLIVVLSVVLFKDNSISNMSVSAFPSVGSPSTFGKRATYDMTQSAGVQEASVLPVPPVSGGGSANPSQTRMVSLNAYLSMVVKDIQEASKDMVIIAENAGGYMVNSSMSNPAGNGTANLTVRVLSAQMREVIESYKKLGIKVVSESISGSDITDQYEDIGERLRVLEDTKAKFEAMLKSSTDVQDSLSVLREVQQLQYQIDNLKGQEKYLEGSAKYSIITVSISKDEFELPYAPEESWSAQVVFKTAVRDLIRTLRSVAEKVIWVVVYAIIWLPVALVALFVYRRFLRKML